MSNEILASSRLLEVDGLAANAAYERDLFWKPCFMALCCFSYASVHWSSRNNSWAALNVQSSKLFSDMKGSKEMIIANVMCKH